MKRLTFLQRSGLFTWMLGLALAALATFAFLALQSQRNELELRIEEDVVRDVSARVDAWERGVRDHLEEWLATAAVSDPEIVAQLQSTQRSRHPWVDSFYTWIPPVQEDPDSQPQPERVLFPRPAPVENPLTTAHSCIHRPQFIARLVQPPPTALEVAADIVRECADAPLFVRAYANGGAADYFRDAGDLQGALALLDALDIPMSWTPRQAAEKGLTPQQLIVHKLRRAETLDLLGQPDEAILIWHAVANDIASLDAPAGKPMLTTYEWQVLGALSQHASNDIMRHAVTVLSRANRRALAWDEVQQRIIPQSMVFGSVAAVSDEGRFAYDQYRELPFLIYYNSVATPDGSKPRAGAIVLDQPALLRHFFIGLGSMAQYVRVTDAKGQYVAGADFDDDVFRQSFPSTLTHLRIEVSAEAMSARVGRFGGSYWPFFIALSVFVAIGFLGLYEQSRATRQQQQLLLRQREFTTRITHELKTPLAGIKVTAENIEFGAFSGQEELGQMALRIVHEADALTDRVNEILAVSREEAIPKSERFDVEEVLLEAVATWSPRYDQAGVELTADLHVTDEVQGDPVAVRDAVSCLLDNALKYRDEAKPTNRVWLSLDQEGKHVVITVDDNGLGVPQKLRKSIFQQFVRVEGPNRGKAGGHGLGLAQVARVAKAHGGAATCTASQHGGARFVLKLRGVT